MSTGRRVLHGCAVAAVMALLAACADQPGEAPTGPGASPQVAVQADAEKTALSELTRAVALALQDNGLRQRVKNDLRNSRYTFEHKLEFGTYIRGESGGILLAKMAQRTGKSRVQLLRLLDPLPDLEFYMPVTAHREGWRGGSDLLVAGALDEAGATLVGFDLDGTRVQLSPQTPPPTPTLVLVPVETDFTKTLDPQTYISRNDNGGESIGTYDIEPCPECGGGGGGGGGWHKPANSVQQRGISIEEFISHMKTPNDHEPWTNGAPEFYLLLAGAYAGGGEFSNRINIPEGPWSGSDDDNNSKWRNFAADTGPISLIVWDTDLGTRIKVQCFESDANFNTTITLTGSTEVEDPIFGFPFAVEFSVSFDISTEDDNCGSNFINNMNTLGNFYYIPDGVDNDAVDPTPPYFDGTSDLHWYGYGLERL